jgi:hypothetical protein
MGQFSVEICPIAGSVPGETQHAGLRHHRCHRAGVARACAGLWRMSSPMAGVDLDAAFQRAIEGVIGREGPYSDDPADRGGATA